MTDDHWKAAWNTYQALASLSQDEWHDQLQDVPPEIRYEVLRLLAEESADEAGDPTLDAEPSLALGPYRLIGVLGEGGMGTVYHGIQTQPLKRRVAVKLLRSGLRTWEAQQRFEIERRVLALMQHENIARVFDAGQAADGRPYFAMELVDGPPIHSYCDSRKLSVRARLQLVIQVCAAVQHAHAKGIIHRDLKPSNVLVVESHGRPIAKVIDFGVARAVEAEAGPTLMTQFNSVVGTLEYMSPEQADGQPEHVDAKTDVYALGVLCYELLVGTTPLRAAAGHATSLSLALEHLRSRDPMQPSTYLKSHAALGELAAKRSCSAEELLKSVSREVDWIVMRALAKEPERRYQTASALADDLTRLIAGDPVEAGPASNYYRVRKLARKHRFALAAVSAVALTLVVAAGVSIGLAIRASKAEAEAKQQSAIAQAVTDFLQNDLLGQASSFKESNRDPDVKVRTVLENAAQRIQEKFKQQPEVEAAIRNTIGQTYQDLGLYTEAATQLNLAVGLRQRVLGPEHPDTLFSMSNLAEIYLYQGHPEQAEPQLKKIVDAQRRVLGPEHPQTLQSMNSLAISYENQGKNPEAEAMARQTLQVRRRVLGAAHPDTLTSMNHLAEISYYEGKLEQARELHNEVLDLRRRVLGPEHPDTLGSMDHTARDYWAQGNYQQAETLRRKVWEIRRRVLGPEHPETLDSMDALAGTIVMEAKYAQTRQLLEGVLDKRRRVLGPEHPDTLHTEYQVGRLYQLQGDYQTAQKYFTHCYSLLRHALGPEAMPTTFVEIELASTFLMQGKFAQSEPLARHAMASMQVHQPDDFVTFYAMSVLGACLAAEKKFSDAEPLLLTGYQGLRARKNVMLVPNYWRLEYARQWLVRLHRDWGKPEKAKEFEKSGS